MALARGKSRTWGIAFVVIFTLGGLVVGLLTDEVLSVPVTHAAQPDRLLHPDHGPSGGSSYARTKEKRKVAARKFRRGRFDQRAAGASYSKRQRKVIKTAIRKAYKRRALAASKATGVPGARTVVPSRATVWRRFTSTDVCSMATWRPGSGMDPNPKYDYIACKAHVPQASKLTDREVRGYICAGYVGIGVAGALAAPVGGGWVFLGAGAAFAQCFWGTFGY